MENSLLVYGSSLENTFNWDLTSYREILLYNTILFMLLTHFGLFELFKEIIQVNQIDEFMYVYDMCK